MAKALARAGVASRREVERYIAAGRVALNGQVLDTPAVKVASGDILTVDGAVVGGPEPTRLFRYHKPAGLITTNSDPQGRATVFEHLPDWLPRVLAVGRLDLNTEGLLLLTNDGALSRALELPSSGWMRRYRARAYGRVDQDALDRLGEGVTVDGVAYGPIEARLDKASGHDRESGAANVWLSIGITEGKNREVRKVLEHLGLKVNRLIRLAYGPFALSTLPLGAVEEVGPRVIREQLAEHVAPENLPAGDRPAPPPPPSSPPRLSAAPVAPRRSAPAKPPASPARRAPGKPAPAEGAERRLAETRPSKGEGAGRAGWAGAKGRPAASRPDRPGGGRSPFAGPAKPKRSEPAATGRAVFREPNRAADRERGAPQKPQGAARAASSSSEARGGGGRPHPAEGPRPERRFSGTPRGAARDEVRADGARVDGPRRQGPRGESPRGGSGKAHPHKAEPQAGAHKAGPHKAGPQRVGAHKAGAKPAAPARTGLELTPPMRRTPRGAGPRRPPRKD